MNDLLKSVITKITKLQKNILETDTETAVYTELLTVVSDSLDNLIEFTEKKERECQGTSDEELANIFCENVSSISVQQDKPDKDDNSQPIEEVITDSHDEYFPVAENPVEDNDKQTSDIEQEVITDNVSENSENNVITAEPEQNTVEINPIEDIIEDDNPYSASEASFTYNPNDEVTDTYTETQYENTSDHSQETYTATPETHTYKQEDTKLKVDEVLSRNKSKDIYKAFTVNDKFRYRKELFCNSTAQYNEALNLISEMDSYEQAADYFLNNYGWDPENDCVKGFLKVVEQHFNA